MTMDSLLSDADPTKGHEIPAPVVDDARKIMRTEYSHNAEPRRTVNNSLRRRYQSSTRRPAWRVAISTVGVIALVVATLTTLAVANATSKNRGLAASTNSAWNLTGYISQPGWQQESTVGPLPTSQQDTLQMTCPSSTTCFSTGVDNSSGTTEGVISTTHDGGATWSQSYLSTDGVYFSGISCPTDTTCMAIGSSPSRTASPEMFRTTNGGETWSLLPLPGSSQIALSLSCSTSLSCAELGQLETEPSPTTVGYATNDGGQSWRQATVPADFSPSGSSQSPLDCFTNDRCIAAGTRAAANVASEDAEMIFSTDAGAIWQSAQVPLILGAGLVSCSSATQCIAIESSFTTFETVTGELVTSDGGAVWTETPEVGLTSPHALAAPWIDSLSCASATECWASAHDISSTCQGSCPYSPDSAFMLVTTDAGSQWTEQSLPTPPASTLQYVGDAPVLCTSPQSCRAVGTLELTAAAASASTPWTQQDVVLTWNGAAPSLSTSVALETHTENRHLID